MKTNTQTVVWCALSVALLGCVTEGGELAADDEAPAVDDDRATEHEALSTDLTVQSGIFRPIKNVGSGMCLQPQDGATGVAPIVQRPCLPDSDPNSALQGWLFQRFSGNDYSILNQHSGLCLYLNGEARDGTELIQVECNGTTNTRWKLSTTRGITPLMSRLRNTDTGFCAEMFNGQPIDGLAAKVFRCFGTPAQAWVVGF
jgi:hypothetical protein